MCNLQEYLEGLTPARDRRLKPRIAPTSVVYVIFGNLDPVVSGIVINVSETGMALAVGNLPATNDHPMRMRFRLPTSNQSIEISARIVWLTESKKGVGVRLVNLTADAGAQISDWIAFERAAAEFGQPAHPLRTNRQPLEISSRRSRRIFSNASVRDEEAAARYVEMFPSESTYTEHPARTDENKPQRHPSLVLGSSNESGDSMLRSDTKILTGGLPQTAGLPQARTASEAVARSASRTAFIFDVSGLQVAALVFLFAVIGLIIGIAATKASIDVLASLGHGPFGKQVRLRSESPHTQFISVPLSDAARSATPTETPSAQTSPPTADLKSSAGANAVGSSTSLGETTNEGTPESEASVEKPSTGSNSPTKVEPKAPAAPEVPPPRNDLSGIVPRSAPVQASIEHAHSTMAVGPTRSAKRRSALLTAKPATAASPKPSESTASSKRSQPTVAAATPKGGATGDPASHSAKPATTELARPSVVGGKHDHTTATAPPKRAASENPASGSTKLAASAEPKPSPLPASPKPADPTVASITKSAPPASAEPAHPTVAEVPKDSAPGSPAPLTAKPAAPKASNSTPVQPNPPPLANFVTVPSKGKLVKVVFPQKQIAFSSSLAITTQLSVLVPPQTGPAAAQPSQLQAGKLVSYVLPHNPRPEDRYGAEETVKVHATIGQQGFVTEVKPLSGPIFLLSSTMSAVRLWRYKPTLLNGTPVETHQDVTIIFRPAP